MRIFEFCLAVCFPILASSQLQGSETGPTTAISVNDDRLLSTGSNKATSDVPTTPKVASNSSKLPQITAEASTAPPIRVKSWYETFFGSADDAKKETEDISESTPMTSTVAEVTSTTPKIKEEKSWYESWFGSEEDTQEETEDGEALVTAGVTTVATEFPTDGAPKEKDEGRGWLSWLGLSGSENDNEDGETQVTEGTTTVTTANDSVTDEDAKEKDEEPGWFWRMVGYGGSDDNDIEEKDATTSSQPELFSTGTPTKDFELQDDKSKVSAESESTTSTKPDPYPKGTKGPYNDEQTIRPAGGSLKTPKQNPDSVPDNGDRRKKADKKGITANPYVTPPKPTIQSNTEKNVITDSGGTKKDEDLGKFGIHSVSTTSPNESELTTIEGSFLVIGQTITRLNTASAKTTSVDKTSEITAIIAGCVNHQCDHECIPLSNDDYKCSCNVGFSLSTDNITCKDIDECFNSNGFCEMQCDNTPGSFLCSCWNGFSLSKNKKDCTDIDECQKEDICDIDEHCLNTEGSYSCVKKADEPAVIQRKLYGGLIIWFSILTVMEIACILLACWETWLDKDLKRLRKDKEEWLRRQEAKRKRYQSSSSYQMLNPRGMVSQGGGPLQKRVVSENGDRSPGGEASALTNQPPEDGTTSRSPAEGPFDRRHSRRNTDMDNGGMTYGDIIFQPQDPADIHSSKSVENNQGDSDFQDNGNTGNGQENNFLVHPLEDPSEYANRFENNSLPNFPASFDLYKTLPLSDSLGRTQPHSDSMDRTLPPSNSRARTLPHSDSMNRTLPPSNSMTRTLPHSDSTDRTPPPSNSRVRTLPPSGSRDSQSKDDHHPLRNDNNDNTTVSKSTENLLAVAERETRARLKREDFKLSKQYSLDYEDGNPQSDTVEHQYSNFNNSKSVDDGTGNTEVQLRRPSMGNPLLGSSDSNDMEYSSLRAQRKMSASNIGRRASTGTSHLRGSNSIGMEGDYTRDKFGLQGVPEDDEMDNFSRHGHDGHQRWGSNQIGMDNLAESHDPSRKKLTRGVSKLRASESLDVEFPSIPGRRKESIMRMEGFNKKEQDRNGFSEDDDSPPPLPSTSPPRENITIGMDNLAESHDPSRKKLTRGVSKLRASESLDVEFPSIPGRRKESIMRMEGFNKKEQDRNGFSDNDDTPPPVPSNSPPRENITIGMENLAESVDPNITKLSRGVSKLRSNESFDLEFASLPGRRKASMMRMEGFREEEEEGVADLSGEFSEEDYSEYLTPPPPPPQNSLPQDDILIGWGVARARGGSKLKRDGTVDLEDTPLNPSGQGYDTGCSWYDPFTSRQEGNNYPDLEQETGQYTPQGSKLRASGSIDYVGGGITINPAAIHPSLRRQEHYDNYKNKSMKRDNSKKLFAKQDDNAARRIYLPEKMEVPTSPTRSAAVQSFQCDTGSYQIGQLNRKSSTSSGMPEFSSPPKFNRKITMPGNIML